MKCVNALYHSLLLRIVIICMSNVMCDLTLQRRRETIENQSMSGCVRHLIEDWF